MTEPGWGWHFVMLHLDVAVQVARRWYWIFDREHELDDLIQEAILGIKAAGERDDPSKGHPAAYARVWANKYVREFGRTDRTIVVPRSTYNGLLYGGKFVSKHTAKDVKRAIRIHQLRLEEAGMPAAEYTDERRDALAMVVAELGPLQKELLRLRFSEGLTYYSIARRLDTTEECIRSRVRRLRTKLENALNGEGFNS